MKKLLFIFIANVLLITTLSAQIHPRQIGDFGRADRSIMANRTALNGVDLYTVDQVLQEGNAITIDPDGTIAVDASQLAGDGVITSSVWSGTGSNRTLTLGRTQGLPDLTAALDLSNFESQNITASGTTSPVLTLDQGGGAITFAGSGGLTLSRSGQTITFTAPAGSTDTYLSAASFTGSGDTRNYTFTVDGGTDVTGSINVDDGDSDNTNEIQDVTRATNANSIVLSDGGGSVSVADVEHFPTVTTTANSSSWIFPSPPAGTVPTANNLKVYLNGVRVPEGVDGTIWTWDETTRTLGYTFRTLDANEKVSIEYALQN